MTTGDDPLRGVDAVPWHCLYHAYGPATEVPSQLRALRSTDPAVRSRASWQLSGNVYHQGTRWQASAPTVPFLIALIDHPATADRAALLDLLAAIAIGERRDDQLPFDSATAFAAASTITEDGMSELIRRLYHEHDPLDDVRGIGLSEAAIARWAADAYQAAADHTSTIETWVTDSDPDVAAHAAALVTWFPYTLTTVSALLSVRPGPSYAPARASANLALAHLPITATDFTEHLGRMTTSPDDAVAVTAAVALAYRLGNDLSQAALTILVEAVDRELPLGVTGWDRALRGFVALALQRIGLT